MNDSLTNLNVLIVDDLASARKILRRLLQNMGFTAISEATSGLEALEIAKSNSFDLIIADLNLGDADGIGLVERLRKHGCKSHYIIITADQSAETFRQISNANILPLLKPFGSEDLRMKIINVLAQTAI